MRRSTTTTITADGNLCTSSSSSSPKRLTTVPSFRCMLLLRTLRHHHRHRHLVLVAMAPKKSSGAASGPTTTPPAPKRRRATSTTTATTSTTGTDADDAALPPSSHGPGAPPAALLAKAERIRTQLASLYPPPVPIPLNHASPFQLLVAVVLSAQSTDLKVNEATPALFAQAPTPKEMAELGAGGILTYVQSIGLAPTKSRNLAALSTLLLERHGGQVPSTLAELVALPGVGRKTASVVLSQAFGGRAFPVDTHIHRLAQRWGLTVPGPSVEQTERDLRAVFPDPSHWRDLHLRIIYFGREHCPAKAHDPSSCPICSWAAVPPFDRVEGGSGGGKRAASVSPIKAGGGGGGRSNGGGAAAAAGGDASEAAEPKRRRAARGGGGEDA